MIYLKCSKVVDRISDIIDGQARLFVRMRFYGHLMICQNCRRYFNQFKTVHELAGKVSSDDLPPDFDHVMAFVMDEIEKQDEKKDV